MAPNKPLPPDFDPNCTDPDKWEEWLLADDDILSLEEEERGIPRGPKKPGMRREAEFDEDEAAFKHVIDDAHDLVERAFRQIEERLGHLICDGSAESISGLIEKIDEIIQRFKVEGVPDKLIQIGCHGSCQTGDLMVVVYERGGLQYHLDTRKIPDLNAEALFEEIEELTGKSVKDLDHYVSDN